MARLYPDPSTLDLRSEIAAYYGIQKEQIFTGNALMKYWPSLSDFFDGNTGRLFRLI
jgi:histidinol-phosphate/aromatic aminotransferase/cobyric acid decarboxylase-like protein